MKKYKIINITGVVWYTRDEWQKMKEVAQDAEKLEDSFEEWEKMMKESKKKMKNAGIKYKKVYIKTDEYVKYCRNKSLPLNTESRSIYLVELLKNEDNKSF